MKDMPFKPVIFIVAFLQFVNMVEFMMVMPLGPMFTSALDIAVNKVGLIAGAYSFSAAIMGLLLAVLLDRFTRNSTGYVRFFYCVYPGDTGGTGTCFAL